MLNKPETDQVIAQMRDLTPAIWWALYTGMLEKGFTSEQAMRLLEVQVYAACGSPGTAFKSSNLDTKKKEEE